MSRKAKQYRQTRETEVEVEIDIDGQGNIEVDTSIPFMNHLLHSMLFYLNADAKIRGRDKEYFDDHHLVEDIGITLGKAFQEALGDKRGINRFGSSIIPMDEALVITSVDISNRGESHVDLKLKREEIGGMAIENIYIFINSFARNSGITIHVLQLRGKNTHHILEACFKGLGMSLREATKIIDNQVRSTKGVI
jgi:imidazoleglycerol-phosphate dehydratase